MTRHLGYAPVLPRLAAGAAAVLVALTLSACSGSQPSAARQTTPTGSDVHDAADDVSFTLPRGWVNIPLQAGTEAALGKALAGKGNPNDILTQIERGQLRGLKAFALDPARPANPTKLDFVVTNATGTTLDGLAKLLQLNFTQLSASNPKLVTVTMPAGQMLRADYGLPDGQATTQYYLIARQHAYELTFTAPSKDRAEPAAYDAVARSLRVG